ncbi:MAG: CpaF family protein, partial [Deltaproteobacteria bacterium]|nr:CpaF family protein [Deltaproteobacteria bacterium]
VPGRDALYQDLKSRVHNRLFDVIDFARISTVSEERVCSDIATATVQILEEEKFLLTLEERERFVKEIQDEVFGLGPLEPLLQDPAISDILVNGSGHIFIERHGKLEKTVARFRDDAHLMRIIDKIVSAVGRRIDESSPLVDARLADGSRVNVIIPPLALDGPSMSIRRFGTDPLTVDDLVEYGALTPEIVELLNAIVTCRLNVLISGGTGSGKTTLLNVVSSFIPEDERIVTIEDSAELQLKQEHVVRLETRPANIEGTGRIAQRDLVINSLRMRPDRIVVGEVRGAESLDMLQAMNTGHDGSLTTVHANTPRDALSRIETMVAMAGLDMPQRSVRNQIASAIDVVVQLSRLSDGRRKLVSLQEITGMEGEIVTMQEIFTFERLGIDADKNVLGEIVPTGVRPKFAEKLKLAGYSLPATLFERQAR